jgi:hypothetical protein
MDVRRRDQNEERCYEEGNGIIPWKIIKYIEECDLRDMSKRKRTESDGK